MTSSTDKTDIVIALIHDDGEIGSVWKKFMEEMFTVDLPENFRDLGLDVHCASISDLDEEEVKTINACSWKLFLLSHDMLDQVQNAKSSLNQSELLQTRSDKVIVLILGEETDTQFHDDVRRSLWVYRDFSKFHLVNATTQNKIFSDVIDIVSPLYIVFHPNIISSEDREQHLTLIANKPYPSAAGAKFQVEFSNENNTVEACANLFNPCTLLLQNPGLSTGMIDAKAYVLVPESEDDNAPVTKTQVGDTMKVWVQSDLDKLNSMLEKNNDPFHFLCQAYKVDANDPSAVDVIDKRLTDTFRKNVPENQLARVFGTDQGYKPDAGEERSREYAPTLLHFAAMHGLKNLTAQLLRCPGAVRAYGMANCDGDYPTNLAEKYGHWDLKNYMQSYMEVSAMVDYEMGDSRNTSEMVAQMVSGQYLPVPESVYGSSDSDINEKPGYVTMKPLTGRAVKHYDSPFVVPIPLSDDIPSYESILAQMIECYTEDTYMEFEGPADDDMQYGFGYGKDAPPPPPRDDVPTPPPLDDYPVPPPRLPALSEETHLPPQPPPLPVERSDENASIRRGGADRVSYGSLSIPKIHSYVSPAQRELITLQQKVKNGELTTNQAVFRFKEWERKHKEQAASFQFQQESLQRLRNSLMKSREMKRQRNENDDIEITKPIVAGSSTYDMVLKKTIDADPSEVIYGSTTKPPKLHDGFTRSSIQSHDSYSTDSMRTNASSVSKSSDDSRKSSISAPDYHVDYRAHTTMRKSDPAVNVYAAHPKTKPRSPRPLSQTMRLPPNHPNEYTKETNTGHRPPPVPPREGAQPPFVPPRFHY